MMVDKQKDEGVGLKGLIDYGVLERFVVLVERLFAEQGLKSEEKFLIIRTLNEREVARVQQRKTSDLMGNVPLGGLMKRLMKKRDETEEGDDKDDGGGGT